MNHRSLSTTLAPETITRFTDVRRWKKTNVFDKNRGPGGPKPVLRL